MSPDPHQRPQSRDGGELLVRLLEAAGVDTVFGIISIHNMPLVQAVDARLRFVAVRHEAAAVNAADAYARVRGGLGCAITSTGTGAGNAAGSMVEALTAGSSVLHIAGQVPLRHVGNGHGYIHYTPGQLDMLRAVSKSAHRIDDTRTSAAVLAEAVGAALTAPRGPVSIEWPIDLQYAAHDLPADPTFGIDVSGNVPAPAEAAASERLLDQVAALLEAAHRPLLWVGGGATRAGAQLVALAERLGCGVVSSNAGRGAVPEDHPLVVGNFASTPVGQGLLDASDLLLSVGTHFRSNETAGYGLRLPEVHVQVDVDGAALGRVYPVTHGVQLDAAAALDGLLARLPGRGAVDDSWPERVHVARTQARATLLADVGPQGGLCTALRRVLPRDGIVVRDVTIPASSWGNRLLAIYEPSTNVFARGGGIGQGVAMSLGAALAGPDRPVCLIVGDGGLAMHLGELLSAVQAQARVTILLFNDRGYGVLRNAQDDVGVPRSGVDLHTPNFEELAGAMGLGYAELASPADTETTLEKAFQSLSPFLVEIDVERFGPMNKPFVPPLDSEPSS